MAGCRQAGVFAESPVAIQPPASLSDSQDKGQSACLTIFGDFLFR